MLNPYAKVCINEGMKLVGVVMEMQVTGQVGK